MKTGYTELDRYVAAVTAGDIAVGRHVMQAVARHVRDLQASAEGGEWMFSVQHARHAVDYFQNLRHWKGRWAGSIIALEDWQIFILGSLFGWLNRATGLRRFREGYIEVPRKNGKTTLLAGVGLYGIDYDNEQGAEVYCAATSRAQASIVFDDAKNMVLHNEKLRREIEVTKGALASPRTRSSFKPLSKEHKRLDGLNTHFGIFDELHAWDKRELYDVIDTSTGSRDQPLLISITTAGSNVAGLAYETRGYVIKLLSQVLSNDRFFGIIYGIDQDDLKHWDQPETWSKANPNFNVSVLVPDLEALVEKARESEAKKNDFLTKRLNVWVNSRNAWMRMDRWMKCEADFDEDDLKGRPCYLTLDLSSKLDLASYVLYFRKDGKSWILTRNYLPSETVKRGLVGSQAVYNSWATSNRIRLCEGETIDYGQIQDDIMEDASRFNIVKVGYDPFQAAYLVQQLQASKLETMEIRQTVTNLSEAMKEVEAKVLREELCVQRRDEVLRWCVANVVCKTDRKDNVYPTKEQPQNKIDTAVALIMAEAMHLVKPLKETYSNNKRKPRAWVV